MSDYYEELNDWLAISVEENSESIEPEETGDSGDTLESAQIDCCTLWLPFLEADVQRHPD